MLMKQADFLIKELRRAIDTYLKDARIAKINCSESWFLEKRGAFVTIKTYPEQELRGCIGYIEPVYPLGEIAVRAAISAAVDDPRFETLRREELENMVLEISVLTKPTEINTQSHEKLLGEINIGKDGLIVSQGSKTGLLLPQVSTENKMKKEEFLAHTCIKAGLPPGSWMGKDTKIQKFQAEVFFETAPGGKVVKEK